jgi:hypothetical protein
MKVILRTSSLVISSVNYQVEITNNNEAVPTVTLNGNGEIHYTIDGTNPISQSPVYTEPFYLLDSATVKAAIFKNGVAVSDVATKAISVAPPKATYWNGQTLTANSSTPTLNQTNSAITTNVNSGDYVVMKFTVTEYPVVGATSHIVRLRDSNFGNVIAKEFYGGVEHAPVIGKEYICVVKATSAYILKYASLSLSGSPSSGNFTVNLTGYIYSGS